MSHLGNQSHQEPLDGKCRQVNCHHQGSPGTARQAGGFLGRLVKHGRRGLWQKVIEKAPGNLFMSGNLGGKEGS